MISAKPKAAGFSLIEVVMATAVMASAVIIVLGLLGPMSRGVGDVLDSEVAARLSENIQGELSRIGFPVVSSEILNSAPIYLYATPDGARVLRGPDPVEEDTSELYEVNLNSVTGSPRGIPKRERYFLVVLEEQPIGAATFSNNSGTANLRATVQWPYRIPLSPASPSEISGGAVAFDPSQITSAQQRQSITFFFAIRP